MQTTVTDVPRNALSIMRLIVTGLFFTLSQSEASLNPADATPVTFGIDLI